MADCIKCGEFFQPTADEERLLASHQMEEVCMKCAMAASEGTTTHQKPPPLRVQEGKYDGTKLFRAEWFDKDNKLLCFVATPPRPWVPLHRSLRKPRKGNIHVTIISGSDGSRATSEPRVVVHTNIASFERTRRSFWVSKVPDFWDPQTGIGRIEIPFDKVDHVSEDKRSVHLKDGGIVVLTYK